MKFKRPSNELEGGAKKVALPLTKPQVEVKPISLCDKCNKNLNLEIGVCVYCGHHYRVSARERIKSLATEFDEMFGDLESKNILGFKDYDEKLVAAKKCGEREAVITGVGKISKSDVALFVMEPGFMMGSMGSVVGEKITRIFEHATKNSLPVIGYSVSGGARMQEGVLSLMQMAKVSGAVAEHNNAGLLFISVVTNPTTGGVTASYAMLGDIIIAEPGALIGFAGPRVIEQTIRQKLPAGFQSAEFLLEKGFVDMIVERTKHKEVIGQLIEMHGGRNNGSN